jgi:hypothetical protein
MAFKRVGGVDRGNERGVISSLACAVGDLLVYSRTTGTLIKGLSSSPVESVAGICVAATTTADTEVLYEVVMPNDKYIVDVTNNSSTADNYQAMVLTDQATVNNTHTTATTGAMVVQVGTVGAAADKKILANIMLATTA